MLTPPVKSLVRSKNTIYRNRQPVYGCPLSPPPCNPNAAYSKRFARRDGRTKTSRPHQNLTERLISQYAHKNRAGRRPDRLPPAHTPHTPLPRRRCRSPGRRTATPCTAKAAIARPQAAAKAAPGPPVHYPASTGCPQLPRSWQAKKVPSGFLSLQQAKFFQHPRDRQHRGLGKTGCQIQQPFRIQALQVL